MTDRKESLVIWQFLHYKGKYWLQKETKNVSYKIVPAKSQFD